MMHKHWTNLWLCALAAMSAAHAQEKMLSEVTVSSTVSDLEERRSAVTQKTIIDRQAIEATGGLTVGDVLGKLPGVNAGVPSSDGTANLSARGMARDSVQVLVDGERPASNSRHAMLMISRMPAGELEQVEILKGASAEFGNAVPVTINLVTNRAKRKDRLEYKLSTGLRGTEPVAHLSMTKEGSNGPWSWTLPLSLNQTRTPLEKETQRRNATGGTPTLWQIDQEKGRNVFTEEYFAPKLNWKEGKSSFSIWPAIFRAQGERKTFLDRTEYADPIAGTGLSSVYQRNTREESRYQINRLRLEGETMAAASKLSGRLSLMNGKRSTDTDWDASSGWSGQRVKREETEINGALRLDRGWGQHMSTLGLEVITLNRDETQTYTGTYADRGDYLAAERQQSLWVQDEWAVTPTVTLSGGLRGEAITLKSDGTSRGQNALSPSLAGKWDLAQGWLLRSSIGTGIKAPKLDEISNAPVLAVSVNSPLEPDRRGNVELKAERNVSVELGLEHYWPNEAAVVGVNTYLRETKDFIERRQVLEGTRWVERPYNEGDARHWGIEFDAKLKTEPLGLKGGALRSHLTLPHATVDDTRLGIRRDAREVPRYILTLGYDQTLPMLSSSAGFLLQRTGETRTDVPSEQWAKTRARSVLDAYWIRKIDRQTNLRITLQNLLGADLRRVVRAYSGGQEWQLGTNDKQARVILVTLEGKW